MSSSKKLNKELLSFRSRIQNSEISPDRKSTKYFQLFTIIITNISDETLIQFTSLFARLSYLISTYNISYQESYILHSFRRQKVNIEDIGSNFNLLVAETAVNILFARCLKMEEDMGMVAHIFQDLSKGGQHHNLEFKREIKVLFKSIDIENKRITAQLYSEPFDNIIVAYDRPDKNEDYTNLIVKLEKSNLIPILVNLIDVDITNDKIYYPGSMVFEPDFLFDVTAISECFGPFANHQGSYLMRKFLQKPVSKPLLIGNMVNYFLDQLVYHPDKKFKDFIHKIFEKDPLGIALLNDQEVREMIVLLEHHFNNIKEVVRSGFTKINIEEDSCQVEPSFYSAKYGIQGRLDLFAFKDNSATIVELKSGSAFRPNNYGLSNNHYHQTLLYDMLIESVYGHQVKRNNFILYSKDPNNPLRFAPAIKAEQRETIKERNQLFLHDRTLLEISDFIQYYQSYAKANSPNIKGFLRTEISTFLKAMTSLDQIERKYCNYLLKFTIRELFINKLGNEGSDKSNGLASLWMEKLESKKDHFNIINHLEILHDYSNSDNPQLVFRPTSDTAVLSNFRVGDLGVLYPSEKAAASVLKHQVFKITVLSLSEREMIFRLRSRQDNPNTFSNYKYWNVEHDSLENGYYDMSRSIYEFAIAGSSFRKVILGRRPPDTYSSNQISCSHRLTEEQKDIFSEIVHSKEYYLLWGPPGTGKTSIMLKEIAHHYITHEKERVLFLAYTNRAVDEICEALCALDPKPSFIRVGSRYSTDPKFHPHLLENQIDGIKDRKSLRDKLKKEKVYVGTVASLIGKVALFKLIKFDVAIVDEASQILESSLIGLLSRVGKFILVGDHLQLPAIVRQDKSFSNVRDEDLNKIGVNQLSSSLFERMYKTAIVNGWDHVIGQLTRQGRMHVDIMSFVNKHFYNNQLIPLPNLKRLTAPSYYQEGNQMNRLIFVPSKADLESESIKVNENEANLIADICKRIIGNIERSQIKLNKNSIGIITPYRAQIAAIKKQLTLIIPEFIKLITVDTVERYQGSARDIIIMSCCMNYSFQMNALVSLSEEGVDRKLNVALTRAKEQFILVGNKDILKQNKVYSQLIEEAKELTSMEYL